MFISRLKVFTGSETHAMQSTHKHAYIHACMCTRRIFFHLLRETTDQRGMDTALLSYGVSLENTVGTCEPQQPLPGCKRYISD